MTGLNQIFAVVLLAGLLGCDQPSPNSSAEKQEQAADRARTASGHATLNEAVAAVLSGPKGWGGDFDATVTCYEKAGIGSIEMIDLDGDGTEEAICFPARYAYNADEIHSPCGATGNCPGYIFQKLEGKWYPIADVGGNHHRIEEQSINGWPVITNAWKMGGQEHKVKVQVYENSRYRVLHTYTFVPWETR